MKKGYSLIEVLVAISILMLSIIGPITIAAKSIQSAQYVRQQNTAFFLAQEGITIANTLRNDSALLATLYPEFDSWAWVQSGGLGVCFQSTGCNIDFRDNTLTSNVTSCATESDCTMSFDENASRAKYQLQQGPLSPYTRILTFDLISPEEVVVVSTVKWNSGLLGGDQEVTLSTSLFDLYE